MGETVRSMGDIERSRANTGRTGDAKWEIHTAIYERNREIDGRYRENRNGKSTERTERFMIDVGSSVEIQRNPVEFQGEKRKYKEIQHERFRECTRRSTCKIQETPWKIQKDPGCENRGYREIRRRYKRSGGGIRKFLVIGRYSTQEIFCLGKFLVHPK
jgi:hypothetical protein